MDFFATRMRLQNHFSWNEKQKMKNNLNSEKFEYTTSVRNTDILLTKILKREILILSSVVIMFSVNSLIGVIQMWYAK